MGEVEKEKAFGDGFDAGQNEVLSYIGPMLDDWDRLNPDQKHEVWLMSPLFVASLNRIKSLMDRT
jgi:hypothetical protein